jgi:hypothetical protein
MKAHDMMDNIEKDFKDDLGIALTIHMDPIILNNPKIDKLQKLVIESLNKLDNKLKIHDFRVVEGITHTNILFDCIVPFEKEYTIETITDHLSKTIIPEKETYYYVIEIDRPFS